MGSPWRFLILILIFQGAWTVTAQTYVRGMDLESEKQIYFVFKEDSQEQVLQIVFPDDYTFHSVTAEYEDNYNWSIMLDQEIELARMKIEFFSPEYFTVSFHINGFEKPSEKYQEALAHLDLLACDYLLVHQ